MVRDVTARLDELQQRAVDAGVREREAGAEIQSAGRILEELRERRVNAYAAGDAERGDALTSEIQGLTGQLDQARARAEGVARAAEAARAELATFRTENARALLEDREAGARETTDKLNASVAETLRLHRLYVAERQEQDRAIAAVPGASPRHDGPPGTHEWEPALRDLERAVRECPQLSPPLPRWLGTRHRHQQDAINLRERLRHKKKLSERDQAELDRINHELAVDVV
jgi:hypothetical protein